MKQINHLSLTQNFKSKECDTLVNTIAIFHKGNKLINPDNLETIHKIQI